MDNMSRPAHAAPILRQTLAVLWRQRKAPAPRLEIPSESAEALALGRPPSKQPRGVTSGGFVSVSQVAWPHTPSTKVPYGELWSRPRYGNPLSALSLAGQRLEAGWHATAGDTLDQVILLPNSDDLQLPGISGSQ